MCELFMDYVVYNVVTFATVDSSGFSWICRIGVLRVRM
jgi:hypothetical protein